MRFSARRPYASRQGSPISAIILLILFSLIAAVVFRGFQLYKESQFGRFDRFNVVLIAEPLTLVSINTRERTAVAVTIPDDLYISELAYGYGAYRAAMVYSVGQLDHRGGETVAATISDYLGVPIDGYIYSPGFPSGDVKKFFLSPANILGANSSVNLLDRLRLAGMVLQMRFDKIRIENLSRFTDQLVLSDGSVALSLDKESVDNHLQNIFIESRIRDENLRLEIINSTPVVGLGNRASRMLTNIGANVVSVGTVDALSQNCQLKATAGARNSLTVARVAKIFSCQMSSLPEEGRAEIEVILGQDYAQRLGK